MVFFKYDTHSSIRLFLILLYFFLSLVNLDVVANVLDQPEPTFSVWRFFLETRVDAGQMLVDHFAIRAGSLEMAVPGFNASIR